MRKGAKRKYSRADEPTLSKGRRPGGLSRRFDVSALHMGRQKRVT
jgi:hypothetical protein